MRRSIRGPLLGFEGGAPRGGLELQPQFFVVLRSLLQDHQNRSRVDPDTLLGRNGFFADLLIGMFFHGGKDTHYG